MTHLRHPAALSSIGVGTWLTASFLLASCMGTDTGNPIGDQQHSGDQVENLGDRECEESANELGWAEESPLGFSPADVLAALPSESSVSLQWLSAPSLSYGPESGTETIEITLEAGEEAEYVTPVSEGQTNEGPDSVEKSSCFPKVRFYAALGLTSAGGALDESLLVPFDAHVPEAAHAHFRLPLEDVAGDLSLELELDDGQSLEEPLALDIELWLTPVGLTGVLRVTPAVLDDEDEPVTTAPIELAAFPAEQPCGLGFFRLDAGVTLHGLSPAILRDALEDASGNDWLYEHEEGTAALSWEFPSALPTPCMAAEDHRLEFLSDLSVTSSDGSVSGSFVVSVSATSDWSGELSSVQMAGGSFEQDLAGAEDLGERYGVTEPAPLDGFDGGMTDFIVDASGAPWGVFRYAGLTLDDCPTDGSQNCLGLVPTVLFGAHFGEPKNGYELDDAMQP